jgi:hypothetical protein
MPLRVTYPPPGGRGAAHLAALSSGPVGDAGGLAPDLGAVYSSTRGCSKAGLVGDPGAAGAAAWRGAPGRAAPGRSAWRVSAPLPGRNRKAAAAALGCLPNWRASFSPTSKYAVILALASNMQFSPYPPGAYIR